MKNFNFSTNLILNGKDMKKQDEIKIVELFPRPVAGRLINGYSIERV